MLLNHLKLALRHLSRQKLYTVLHLVGLTLGMSTCLLIFLFFRYEQSFDTYHDQADRTYRITSVWTVNGKRDEHFSTPLPLADLLRSSLTGVEHVALAHPSRNNIIEVNPQKKFTQDHLLIVDPEFINVFNVTPVSGDPYKVLRQPYQALLTQSAARKFYGSEDPVGKTFKLGNKYDITVGGVIADIPAHTHLPASVLLSFVPDEKFLDHSLDGWTWVSGSETLVTVSEGFDLKKLEARLKAIADERLNSLPDMPKYFHSDFGIQPITQIHFQPEIGGGGGWVKAIQVSWLWFFVAIGIAVLVLACINFMNLSTAQALTRAKEVGVRKTVGAGRFSLIFQFLVESLLLAFVSGMLSMVITEMSLPAMNTLLNKDIKFEPIQVPLILAGIGAGIVCTGVLAGLYPAWVIARFNPAATLKAGLARATDHGSLWMRKGLVIIQFTVSAGLLIALALISQQVNFLHSRGLGFDKENVLNVDIPRGESRAIALSNELNSLPFVKAVSFGTATPSNDGHWGTGVSRVSREDPERKEMTLILGDEHYGPMYGFELKAGRFLIPSDTSSSSRLLPEDKQVMKAVVNETLVRALNFNSSEEAVGQRIWITMNSGRVEIVGVVGDFNTGSLHTAIHPTMILSWPSQYSQAGIKLEAGTDYPGAITAIETAWRKIYPEGVFDYKFLDRQIDAFYNEEARVYTLFKVFAGLAMLISCLGLWGLSALSAQQRTKEIGIRKVLGATVRGIVMMLSREFLIMVLLALILASPVAYWLLRDWLQQFAYHISIGWSVFAFAAVATGLITIVTVSLQAVRAALANPVDALRSE